MMVGSRYLGDGKCTFCVWAPLWESVDVRLLRPKEVVVPMKRLPFGYWTADVEGVYGYARYLYRLGGEVERPDPASHFQPQGVHGPSQVVDHKDFNWDDEDWRGIPLEEMILYELHVGTFTRQGTFASAANELAYLKDLGVNAVSVMPIAQFPGERNWGYDGVYPYAVQSSYGGPSGFKEFVKACHAHGLAVVLDVVYNHLGPEGNYLADFAPYFTDKYKTPWGSAINFDGAYSDEVRNFFIGNAIHWFCHYHVDGLRLDAVHAIYDASAKPFLEELVEAVEELSESSGRKLYLIAESDLNDVKVIRPRELGGFGIDAQWCDDFHHALHALLTGEKHGYYVDFGKVPQLAKSFEEGYVYTWEYSAFRRRHHGSPSKERPAHQFVVFSQNHDQVGNRAMGERLSALVSFEVLKLAAGAVILSPYIPMLFMGEEYGETSPFLYFTSHSGPDLIEAVRKGRTEEFAGFDWPVDVPDPQDASTFERSKLKPHLREERVHHALFRYYRELLHLRKSTPSLSLPMRNVAVSTIGERVLLVHRPHKMGGSLLLLNLSPDPLEVEATLPPGEWVKVLDSSEEEWLGPGASLTCSLKGKTRVSMRPWDFALYRIS
jgi:maltooligosyltrehalose trehalohydrolase